MRSTGLPSTGLVPDSSPHTSLPALHPSTAGGEHPEGEKSHRQLGLSLVGPELKV